MVEGTPARWTGARAGPASLRDCFVGTKPQIAGLRNMTADGFFMGAYAWAMVAYCVLTHLAIFHNFP
jgi:hypothetical protein